MKPTANGTVHPESGRCFGRFGASCEHSLSGVHELVQLVQTEVLRTTLGLSAQKLKITETSTVTKNFINFLMTHYRSTVAVFLHQVYVILLKNSCAA